MTKHILAHYESVTEKEWIGNLRARGHNQSRRCDCSNLHPTTLSGSNQENRLQLKGGLSPILAARN